MPELNYGNGRGWECMQRALTAVLYLHAQERGCCNPKLGRLIRPYTDLHDRRGGWEAGRDRVQNSVQWSLRR
jgi:hypothetical protein